MFRFRLGRIPVEVHFSHLLVSGLFAYGFRPQAPSPHWPDYILADPAHPSYGVTMALFVFAWMAIFFVSVLVHELGHATVSLAYGYRPQVQLAWLGGHTQPNPNETIPWHKDVLLTLAGPLFGLLLGLASLGAWMFVRQSGPEPLSFVFSRLFGANVVWAVVNLIPVHPLDGGRIAAAVLLRIFGRPGFLAAQVLALLCGGAAIAYFASQGLEQNLLLIVLFGMFASRSVGLIAAYFRGEVPQSGPRHPSEVGLVQALELFRQGKLEDARKLGEASLTLEPAPLTRARLHHLLGWISVKSGEGRPALDHFSQVQGQTVEPQALAAAFSLVGDDERALTLWELAYRETQDKTILHEWAGALLRLGRRDAVSRLPASVDAVQALGCAERVLFIRGEHERAGELAEEALGLAPTPERAYDAACAFARAGKVDRAIDMLRRAQALGFRDVDYALSDADLSSLHTKRAFQEWALEIREKGKHRAMTES